MLDGLVGDIAIPKQTGAATAYWVAEHEEITESEQTFEQIQIVPKVSEQTPMLAEGSSSS
ncbi:MAG: phage major capsid protein [Deltaproteobacteria bacterium]|nr:phage major capsid protein [Deltaproteobacteria bacterium]MBW1927524.1 phage major capsid protein [Deltaproteobacteria bacterium]MBW2026548.1 phage major capsid protein [Deltaproteobacteria bacterium]MBW2125185.1 phage major capsid protein [Deltaproteobacteria bacterium]